MTAARAAQDTPAFKDRYRARAGVEGTIAQATHVTGIRRARYIGLDKTRLEHLAAATAINCIRLDAWYAGLAPRPDQNHPPPAPRPGPHRMNRIRQQGPRTA